MSASGQRHGRVGVGILGAGNVGGDLVHKLAERCGSMELVLVADSDASAVGLRSARRLGVPVSDRGIDALLEDPAIELVFDATTASAYVEHAPRLRAAGKLVVDLTPAASSPCVVPLVNLTSYLDADEVSLVGSAAQATVPVVRALTWVTPLVYVEVTSVLASSSVGPGARRDLDEVTIATATALREAGGARHAKAITIVSPAEPPPPMRSTVRAIPEQEADEEEVADSVFDVVDSLGARLPGYRLETAPRFERRDTPWGRRATIALRVELTGAGDLLPAYSGNLDVMSASALDLGEELACQLLPAETLAVQS